MPSSNGVYSLPPGYLATTGGVIQISEHNPIFEDVAAALTARLSRDGTAPMTGALQLASGTVGLPGGAFASDPTTGLYKTTAGFGVAVGGVKVAEFTSGGIASGARFLGELIPYTGTAAPALTVLPFGQTLSRITYAALWVQAQIEIAAGNTFYNNGDGSTTFGIGDLRGRAPFGRDTMGGVAASRLTTAGSGVNGAVLGSVGGVEKQTIANGNLPANIPNNIGATFTPTSGAGALFAGTGHSISNATGGAGADIPTPTTSFVLGGTIAMNGSINGSGANTPLVTVPPIVVTNYLLFAGA